MGCTHSSYRPCLCCRSGPLVPPHSEGTRLTIASSVHHLRKGTAPITIVAGAHASSLVPRSQSRNPNQNPLNPACSDTTAELTWCSRRCLRHMRRGGAYGSRYALAVVEAALQSPAHVPAFAPLSADADGPFVHHSTVRRPIHSSVLAEFCERASASDRGLVFAARLALHFDSSQAATVSPRLACARLLRIGHARQAPGLV